MDWTKKRVFITGGTGSIGRVLTEILIREYNPLQVVLFSHSESKQFAVKKRFIDRGLLGQSLFHANSNKISFRIGDIGDPQSVESAMIGANIVIHLAAMKHIALCEENPAEAIRTNIEGTKNIYQAVWKYEPDIVLLMSTDKAYGAPYHLYGYTKAISERLFLIADNQSKKCIYDEHRIKFCIVRCGNILDSDGSVTQIWRQQIKKGKWITVTDPKMTRFWISLPQIARFIIQSIEKTEGGETFIPEIFACSIGQLANIFTNKQLVTQKGDNERVHERLSSSMVSNKVFQLTDKELRAMLKENERYL